MLAIVLTVVAVLISRDVPDGPLRLAAAEPVAALTDGVVTVEVRAGDSAKDVATALGIAGAIDSPRRFETLVSLMGYESRLAPGVYDFEPGLTTTEIIERIRAGITSPLQVTIPEGLRLEEIADRLEAAGVVSAAEFLAAARDPAAATGTLAARRPAGTSLEGYLFPSRYRFSLRAGGAEVVRLMLQRFDAQFPRERVQAILDSGRTLHAVITIASIVEREAALGSERSTIASVFWNRLAAAIPLQADPTVQYALANDPARATSFGWWKRALTLADLEIASAWNTYVAPGLPPTPIAAPGEAAIEAAINPEVTNLIYFVARGDGSHAFAETFEEHLENVTRFQGEGVGAGSP